MECMIVKDGFNMGLKKLKELQGLTVSVGAGLAGGCS